MGTYVGRFAPSPTGPLHFGSLVAALGSCVQARAQGGRWLVRIEDIDPPREVPGAAQDILRTLERFGFQWDGPVVYQSQRRAGYEEALARLASAGAVYACTCSRKDLAEGADTPTSRYPGTCRTRHGRVSSPHALRVRTDDRVIEINDVLQGRLTQALELEIGDFVVRRRDGLFAYQLAVVVDDHLHGVTEVVRGCDLLHSTPRQWYLQTLLGYEHPNYVHLPIALDDSGRKLSKQTGALPIAGALVSAALHDALAFLGQAPPPELRDERPQQVWDWAIEHWQLAPIRGVRSRSWKFA